MTEANVSTEMWKPLQLLSASSDTCCKYDLILLNQPYPCDTSLFKSLWNKAHIKVVVDGGANSLYNSFVYDRDDYLPDLLTGDFDSIQIKVKSYYKEKRVEIVGTPDQNFTDFTKALRVLSERSKDKQVDSVVVYGSFAGRLDHVFAMVNTLYEASQFIDKKIFLVSQDTSAFLLKPGHHTIEVDPDTSCEWCGLIPVGEPCDSVTTQGLKWNLDNQKLKFGDLISTSNTLATQKTKTVTIQTDRPLLWTMGIKMGQVRDSS